MTKIDIVSGFLGAGKTTLIKKMLSEAYQGEKLVLIENEFGEISIDGGFLKDSGVQISEMSSGCICCSLVGDFNKALRQVHEQLAPDRILIEPSGVGKLSDVIVAVENTVRDEPDMKLNSFVTVADATKVKVYMKNFGEFYNNQIESAGTIILSRTQKLSQEKLEAAVALLREKNPTAAILTTPWDQLDGKTLLSAVEKVSLADELLARMQAEHEAEEAEHHYHHHDHDEHDDHDEHHHHHDHDEDEDHCCCGHHHDDDDDDEHDEQGGHADRVELLDAAADASSSAEQTVSAEGCAANATITQLNLVKDTVASATDSLRTSIDSIKKDASKLAAGGSSSRQDADGGSSTGKKDTGSGSTGDGTDSTLEQSRKELQSTIDSARTLLDQLKNSELNNTLKQLASNALSTGLKAAQNLANDQTITDSHAYETAKSTLEQAISAAKQWLESQAANQ